MKQVGVAGAMSNAYLPDTQRHFTCRCTLHRFALRQSKRPCLRGDLYRGQFWFLRRLGWLTASATVRGDKNMTNTTAANGKEAAHFGVPWEDAYGYAQAIKVGDTIYVSGQFSHDGKGSMIA